MSYSTEQLDWIVRAECGECGGYELSLQVGDPTQGDLAKARGVAFFFKQSAGPRSLSLADFDRALARAREAGGERADPAD